MDVMDHSPRRWFLLADGDGLYLDTNVHQGPVGLSLLIALNEDEVSQLEDKGLDFLDALSDDIQHSAPFATGGSSSYRSRDLTASRGAEVAAAVDRWRERTGIGIPD
jgi:hypothetical protein